MIKLTGLGLEIYQQDLGRMTWGEAEEKLKGLGDGWRFPSLQELRLMKEMKDLGVGGFYVYYFNVTSPFYWSGQEGLNNPRRRGADGRSRYAYSLDIDKGKKSEMLKSDLLGLRPVRDI